MINVTVHHENPRKTCTQNTCITVLVVVMSAKSDWRTHEDSNLRPLPSEGSYIAFVRAIFTL